jgi:hypothetical protein
MPDSTVPTVVPTGTANYGSRWTVSGEKAGRQTATYSAPSGDGEL